MNAKQQLQRSKLCGGGVDVSVQEQLIEFH